MADAPCACLQGAEADLLRISNKVRFILAVVNGELVLAKRRKAEIEGELENEGYDKLPSQKKALAQVHSVAGGAALAALAAVWWCTRRSSHAWSCCF